LNRLGLGLEESWLSARCGYMSDALINMRATFDVQSHELSQELRQANNDCSALLGAIRSQRSTG
jgi:hypothetical protein